jgi:menaquinol-cytochrome c reductase iron-sulfur subunit
VDDEGRNGAPVENGDQGLYQGPRAADPHVDDPHADDPGYHTRTKFLSMIAVAMGGVMGAAILVPVIGFAVADTVGDEEWTWVDVTSFGEIAKDSTGSFEVSGPFPESDRRVFIRNRDDELIAIWNRCAHLGCPTKYSEGADSFICPCHGGAYDSRGRVSGGPPPRPLDRLDIKIVNAQGQDVEYANAEAADRVLVGKAYSIDAEERPYKLRPPGDPVDGVISKLFPFV